MSKDYIEYKGSIVHLVSISLVRKNDRLERNPFYESMVRLSIMPRFDAYKYGKEETEEQKEARLERERQREENERELQEMDPYDRYYDIDFTFLSGATFTWAFGEEKAERDMIFAQLALLLEPDQLLEMRTDAEESVT